MSTPSEELCLQHLPEKVRLLYGNATYRTDQGTTAPLLNQKQLAQALGIDAGDLSRALSGDSRRSPKLDSGFLDADREGNLPPFCPGACYRAFCDCSGSRCLIASRPTTSGASWRRFPSRNSSPR